MSDLSIPVRNGDPTAGGIIGYPLDWVYHEVAWLGTQVHWTLDDLLHLDHRERARWIEALRQLETGET